MSKKKTMNLYYYISDEYSNGFYSLKGQVYQEYEVTNYDGDLVKGYTELESFRCFISKDLDRYEDLTFEINFGKDSSKGLGVDNLKDFKAHFAKKLYGDWEPVTRKEYEAFRRRALDLYQQRMFLDISSVKTVQDYSVRSITQ